MNVIDSKKPDKEYVGIASENNPAPSKGSRSQSESQGYKSQNIRNKIEFIPYGAFPILIFSF